MNTSQLRLPSGNFADAVMSRSRELPIARISAPERSEYVDSVQSSELELLVKMWFDYCQVERHSPNTIAARRPTLIRLEDYLSEHGIDICGPAALMGFFAQLVNTKTGEELKVRTSATIHEHLFTFFGWLVKQDIIDISPMRRVPRPIVRPDQIAPLANDQIKSIVQVARNSYFPRHNELILRFLLDTGVRASELCSIKMGDVDMGSRGVSVIGKGNKRRTIHYGALVSRQMWGYLRGRGYIKGEDDEDALFVAQNGPNKGNALTRNGVFQMVQRMGQVAGLTGVRCSPHTLRHTFAVNFIRNGGDPFSLMLILGHTDMQMTNRYVTLAEADIQSQHAKCSPMDNVGF